jgi:hypothetical protein
MEAAFCPGASLRCGEEREQGSKANGKKIVAREGFFLFLVFFLAFTP